MKYFYKSLLVGFWSLLIALGVFPLQAIAFPMTHAPIHQPLQSVQVVKVLDSTTLAVMGEDHQTFTVKLGWIQAPPQTALQSQQRLQELLPEGEEILVWIGYEDQQKAKTGEVYLQKMRSLNQQLVKEGLALPSKALLYGYAIPEVYYAAEAQARQNKVGYWQAKFKFENRNPN